MGHLTTQPLYNVEAAQGVRSARYGKYKLQICNKYNSNCRISHTHHHIGNCLTYKNGEIELSGDLQGYVVLGQIAFDCTLRLLNCLFCYFWLIFSFLLLCK